MRILYYDKKVPPKTVLLSGTGIVKGSWRPVRNALLKFHTELPEGEENLAFASEIQLLRQIASAYRGGIKLVRFNLGEYFNIRGRFKEQMSRYYSLKKEIAFHLHQSMDSNEISYRETLLLIDSKWLKDTESKVVITTNWDLVLEEYFTDTFVYHLHGDITDHTTLYLPSEHSWESYHHIEAKGKLPRHYKRITHGNWLISGVQQLIIAGLSLSPLDAELNSLLRSATDKGPIKEVIIIDPYPELIYQRLLFHTRGKIEKSLLIRPHEL